MGLTRTSAPMLDADLEPVDGTPDGQDQNLTAPEAAPRRATSHSSQPSGRRSRTQRRDRPRTATAPASGHQLAPRRAQQRARRGDGPRFAAPVAGRSPGDERTGRRVGGSAVRAGGSSLLADYRLLLVSVGVIGLGLLLVLLINSELSEGAFRQHKLEVALILLAEKEEAMARAVQVDEAPLTIEKRARELGMVPAEAPVFLDLRKGRMFGEPVPAPTPTGPVELVGGGLTAPAERLSGTLLIPSPQPSPEPGGAAADPAATPSQALGGQGQPAPDQSAAAANDPTASPASGPTGPAVIMVDPQAIPAPSASASTAQPSTSATGASATSASPTGASPTASGSSAPGASAQPTPSTTSTGPVNR